MSLRAQLLAFGLLTLVLPWAGYRFVQEMEAALRSGLELSLLASAGTVAAGLDDQAVLLERRYSAARRGSADTLYAAALGAAPRIDGVRDDWTSPADAAFELDGGHRLWLGVHDRYAYLFFTARDSIVYESSPGQSPYGDRLLIAVEPEHSGGEIFLLGTRAPGAFRARATRPPLYAPLPEYEDRIQSAWQETADGFSVEARLPLSLVGAALGVAFIDVDEVGDEYRVELHATWDVEHGPLSAFVQPVPQLERLVRTFGQPGDRFRVIDVEGWVLTDTGPTAEPVSTTAQADGLAGALFRFMLRRDDPEYGSLERRPGYVADPVLRDALDGRRATAWYRGGPEGNATVVAAVPIRSAGDGVLGAVLLEQRSDPILTLTNRALLRLMTFTLLSTAVVALGLLGYATLLSVRVRRLARAAENALGPKGEIDVALPGRNAKDELGDLSRSFANLLERLREHTHYLKTLAGKLSHELRTPLAVVSTSLENLEQEVDSPGARPYLERLRDGAGRLDSILAAMSEATRMEQAIRDTDPQRFDLAAVVEACGTAYADIFRDRRIEVAIGTRDAQIVGSGELVAQLIDKLIDNAVGFSDAGSTIRIALQERPGELELSVANAGPTLPDEMRGRLFDSLVSVRDGARDDGRPHLGLGLYIVALIADFHGGSATAGNLPDDSGAVFRVSFPKRRP